MQIGSIILSISIPEPIFSKYTVLEKKIVLYSEWIFDSSEFGEIKILSHQSKKLIINKEEFIITEINNNQKMVNEKELNTVELL